ncbi:MAG: MG2 domain-containing protein, partial [Planctomycetota bacterium]
MEDALDAARAAGSAERLRLARLLLAECSFNESVDELVAVADGKGDPADRALDVLARHAEERAKMAERVPLVPLGFDLDRYLSRRALEPGLADLIRRARERAAPKLSPETDPEPAPIEERIEIFDMIREDDVDYPVSDDYVYETPETDFPSVDPMTLDEAFIETDSVDLLLWPEHPGPVTGDVAIFQVRSTYCGPIGFRLYRLADKKAWEEAGPQTLRDLVPVRSWSREFHPLRENNRGDRRHEAVEVDGLGEGYYLVAAEARYAPVTPATKFIVSRVALYLRAARNRAIVVAVDRRDGRPRPGVPIELRVAGKPDPGRVASALGQKDDEAFRAGFEGAGAEAAPENRESYESGVAARARYPDISRTLRGETAEDGCATFPLDIGRQDYSYSVEAVRLGPGLAEAKVEYQEPKTPPDEEKTVVWSARPIYRPGQAAHFKGVIRRFNGLRVAPHEASWKSSVEVEIKNAKGSIWKGVCPLSDVGAFNAEFEIPRKAGLGTYGFYVDGRQAAPKEPIKIEEYRLPTFKVSVVRDQWAVRGGGRATGYVLVRYFTHRPVMGAEVEVVLETGEPDPPAVTVITDSAGKARYCFDLPRVEKDVGLQIRATAMDSSGESYSGSTWMRAKANPFDLRVRASPNPAEHGSEVSVSVVAESWSDKPMSGVTVSLEGSEQSATTGLSTGRAVLWLTVAAEGESQDYQVVATGEHGTVRAGGRVRLVAKPETPDAPEARGPSAPKEKEHRDRFHVWAYSYVDAGQDMTVKVDVDNASGADSTVVLFCENTRLLSHRTIRLAPGEHKIKLPTDLDFAPSVDVHAVMLTGDKHRETSNRAHVRAVHRFLTIEAATDKQNYRPGERCRAELRATDYKGRPVPHAEISLGVIHAAVYNLRADPTPDLRWYFHHYDLPDLAVGKFDWPGPFSVSRHWWKGPKYAWGRLQPSRPYWFRGGGGRRRSALRGGGSRRSEMVIALRKDFRETAHWVADLVTDADGRASTEFTFPDDMTSWRFTARGVTPDTMVGAVHMSRTT